MCPNEKLQCVLLQFRFLCPKGFFYILMQIQSPTNEVVPAKQTPSMDIDKCIGIIDELYAVLCKQPDQQPPKTQPVNESHMYFHEIPPEPLFHGPSPFEEFKSLEEIVAEYNYSPPIEMLPQIDQRLAEMDARQPTLDTLNYNDSRRPW